MSPLAMILIWVWGAGLLLAGAIDFARFVIPNRLNLALGLTAALALTLAVLGGRLAPLEALLHVLVAALVLGLGLVLFIRHLIGGGDAKLLAVLALWEGPAGLPATLVIAALAGGLFSLAILAFRAVPLPASLLARAAIARLHLRGGPIPYGVPIALAGLVTLNPTPL